jgi:hypothetical protein
MSKELTPWFPADVKPVRPGKYNSSYQRDPNVFFYWDGKQWVYGPDSGLRGSACTVQDREWRGLAKKP